MLTTIPTEPGWNIKVDGKKVEPVEILKAFIGIELEPGTHTVTMKYTPPGFNLGIITLILGIAIIVLIYLKSDKAIYAQLTEKKKKLEEEQIKAQEKVKSKANKLIKSKGAVANIDIEEIDKKDNSEKSDDDNKNKD